MKTKLFILITALLFSNTYASFGFFKQYVILNSGSGNQYFGNTLSTYFSGQNLGAFDLINPLILNGAEANTYNDNGDNVDYSNFYYRVYETSVDPSAVPFIQIPLGFRSLDGNNKLWDQTSQNINLITNLIGGKTYYLEVYFEAHVNYNGGGGTLFYDSNGGFNYRATFTTNNPLPVELSSFSASVIGNAVKLNWRTETEINNYGFDIERSLPQPLPKEGAFGTPLPLGKGQGDGLWTKIGFVNGNGNSNSPKSYTFTDTDVLSGKYSYRLKQIDNDGQFEYSKTIEVDLGTPTKFELAQNFPNPFNPETAIRFTLPTAGNVRLTIYNLLGQEVKSLVNAFKEAGTHIINFNASEFNSGVYIYKLEANGITQTRKMTLIK